MALPLSITCCTSIGQSKVEQRSEEDSIVLVGDSQLVIDLFSMDGELTWNEISKMDYFEKRRFYLSLTDSISDLWKFKDVDDQSYAIVDTIPPLPEDEIIHLHYKQKVKGYKVSVDFVQSYSDLNFGKSILRFTKPDHSFKVYCDAFSDEQLIADDTPYVKSQKAINLAKLKPGANIYLNYVKPKRGEYLSASSPFYFKDMDFDGEEELVINNLEMGSRGYNTYDIFKVLGLDCPLRLMGLPFNNGEYKITNYNVEYEPKTLSILDKRYDGFTAYGFYRYKSIPATGKNGLSRVFILEGAEDMGFYHPKDKQASDSINLIQPYKKYKRENGKLIIFEKGVYESGNYGQNYNEVVLERINLGSKGK